MPVPVALARTRGRRSACRAGRTRLRSRSTAGVMIPRSSAISGRCPSSSSTAWKSAAPGPRCQRPSSGLGRAARHRPVGDEAAEVVDPGDVDELERAPEALDPPAVALAPHRAPVVDRLAPELALGMRDVGRGAGDEVLGEELGVRARPRRSPRRRRSGCRRSAGCRARPRSARSSLHSRSNRTWSASRAGAGVALPVVGPVRVAARGSVAALGALTGASGSASSPRQPANADDDVYGEPNGSGGLSGSTCHQLCPASSSQSTNS